MTRLNNNERERILRYIKRQNMGHARLGSNGPLFRISSIQNVMQAGRERAEERVVSLRDSVDHAYDANEATVRRTKRDEVNART